MRQPDPGTRNAGDDHPMDAFSAKHGPQIQTFGSSHAFWVPAGMILVGALRPCC